MERAPEKGHVPLSATVLQSQWSLPGTTSVNEGMSGPANREGSERIGPTFHSVLPKLVYALDSSYFSVYF